MQKLHPQRGVWGGSRVLAVLSERAGGSGALSGLADLRAQEQGLLLLQL